MGKIILFDYGHGGTDSGAILNGRYEKNDVLKIGKAVRKIVQGSGVQVDETRTDDKTVSLKQRSDYERKKKYDFFISFHRNAFNKKASGVETFTFISRKPNAVRLATNINNAIVKVGFKNRGVKNANFHVLRETKADAVLIEIGFIDNVQDNILFDSKFNEIVQAIAGAILETLGIKQEIPEPDKSDLMFRVVTGSFKNRENAVVRMEQLKMKGFDSFIDIYRGF